MNGVPVRNISIVMGVLVFAFLVAGVVLTITEHTDQANLLFGVAVGTVTGTGATTVVVQNAKNGVDSGP